MCQRKKSDDLKKKNLLKKKFQMKLILGKKVKHKQKNIDLNQ